MDKEKTERAGRVLIGAETIVADLRKALFAEGGPTVEQVEAYARQLAEHAAVMLDLAQGAEPYPQGVRGPSGRRQSRTTKVRKALGYAYP